MEGKILIVEDDSHISRLVVFVLQNINEQKKIAAVLDGLDKEIDCLIRLLGGLNQQKRGLIQKLLTGKIRVRV